MQALALKPRRCPLRASCSSGSSVYRVRIWMLMDSTQPIDFFKSERLRFRTARDDDYPTLHRWWSDPEIAHYQISDTVRLKFEETNTETFKQWMGDKSGAGFIIELLQDGAMIGFCNLWGADLKNRSSYLAIMLGKDYWNRGYGSEATRLLLAYAFLELNYHRVELNVAAFNDRGIAAYKKAGFKEVGRRRERTFRNGTWHDEVIMDILQSDYLSRTA